MPQSKPLTQHLLSLDPQSLHHATHAPFLTKAATASLPAPIARTWLAQDRLYALNYANFVAALLAKVAIPSTSNRTQTLNWRIADCLIDCLTNIKTEVQLFEDVAAAQAWSEVLDETTPNEATRDYQGLFAAACAPNASLLKGMVALWATEECYLRAWSGAAENLSKGEARDDDVMAKTFIPNWSSKEFGQFVGVLRELVDEMGVDIGEGERRECEGVWRWTLTVEKEFWPDV